MNSAATATICWHGSPSLHFLSPAYTLTGGDGTPSCTRVKGGKPSAMIPATLSSLLVRMMKLAAMLLTRPTDGKPTIISAPS